MSRSRIVGTATIAVWIALAIGTFEPFYLRIHARDPGPLRERFLELPYQKIPGLRSVLTEVDARTPQGARILLVLPHRTWAGGYEYGYRRSIFLLSGKNVLPLIDRESDRVIASNVGRAEYIACIGHCVTPAAFRVVWSNAQGELLRRAP